MSPSKAISQIIYLPRSYWCKHCSFPKPHIFEASSLWCRSQGLWCLITGHKSLCPLGEDPGSWDPSLVCHHARGGVFDKTLSLPTHLVSYPSQCSPFTSHRGGSRSVSFQFSFSGNYFTCHCRCCKHGRRWVQALIVLASSTKFLMTLWPNIFYIRLNLFSSNLCIHSGTQSKINASEPPLFAGINNQGTNASYIEY